MILIKLATRSRPTKFAKALENIKHMTLGEYSVIVSADINDKTMNNPQILKHVSNYSKVKIFYGPPEGKIRAINRDIPKDGWQILVNLSDDVEIKVRGWDNIIRNRVRERWPDSTDWFAHFSDGYIHAALPTISIMGFDYFQRDGYIYHSSYNSFSSDSEAYLVSIARKKYHYFPDLLFKHEHPANNRRIKNDALYKINSLYGASDIKNYFERLNNDFYLDIPGPHIWDEFKTKVTV